MAQIPGLIWSKPEGGWSDPPLLLMRPSTILFMHVPVATHPFIRVSFMHVSHLNPEPRTFSRYPNPRIPQPRIPNPASRTPEHRIPNPSTPNPASLNPESRIPNLGTPNPESLNPESRIPQPRIPNPESRTPNPESGYAKNILLNEFDPACDPTTLHPKP